MNNKRRSSFYVSLQGVVAAASRRNAAQREESTDQWLDVKVERGRLCGIQTVGVFGAFLVAFVCGLFLGMLLFQPTVLVSDFEPTGKIQFYRRSDLTGLSIDVQLAATLHNVSRFPGQLKFSGSLGSSGIHLVGVNSTASFTSIMEGYIVGVAIKTDSGHIDRSIVPLRPHANLPIVLAFRGTRAGFGRRTLEDYIIDNLANTCAEQHRMIARVELESMNFFTLAGFASSHTHSSNLFEIKCRTTQVPDPLN